MNRRKIYIWSLLIVITLCFIWGNSLLPAEQSGQISAAVQEIVERIVGVFFPDYSARMEESGDGLLRKLAHFTEFLILGIELTVLLVRILKRSAALPPLGGLLAALTDETLQLFSEGRASLVTDVWIDFGGVLTGFLLTLLFTYRRKRRQTRKAKKSSR